jgi:hypothetical protein
MEISEKIDQLVQTKKWSELTPDEKTFVVDVLGSEDQYHALRDVEFALPDARARHLAADPAILKRLKHRYLARHAQYGFSNAFQLRVPAYGAAIAVLLIGCFSWYIGMKSSTPAVTTKVVHHIDTLMLASKPDTVYVDRIVYKTVQVKSAPEVATVSKKNTGPGELGVNMKESEALQHLLVSGSE